MGADGMPNLTVFSKRQICPSSTRSRRPSVDGDCLFEARRTCGFVKGPPATSGRDSLAESTLGGIASSRSVVNGADSVEPPDVRCGFHGLVVRPNTGLFAC
jgi:hypothetical protein